MRTLQKKEASTQSIHDFEITLPEECPSLTPINFGRGPRKVTIIVSGVPNSNTYKIKTGETPIMAGLADKREQPIQSYLPNYEIHNTHSEENGGFVITGSFMIHDGPDNLQTGARMWGAAGCMEVVGENGFSTMKEFIFSISGSENTDMEKGLQELVNSKNLWLKLEGTQRPPVIEYKE